ncbi:hypothetical protein RJ55_07297 [Drechmeria coniospora]|nr:hypothetical protein RJ55_07297 [Drechmeria coniospora]
MPIAILLPATKIRQRRHRQQPRQPGFGFALMADLDVSVQPPSRVQTGRRLYPPVVVRHSVSDADAGHHFATVVLVDEEGAVVDADLDGIKAASRLELGGSGEAGPSTLVFAFADLRIAREGTFVIRVDVYHVAPAGAAGAVLVGQVQTRPIRASAAETAAESPSSDEQALMRSLGRAGFPPPPGP